VDAIPVRSRIRTSSGNVAAQLLGGVFGNPIDQKFWDLKSPFLLAPQNTSALLRTKDYFDCGTEESFGINRGASELHQILNSLKIPLSFISSWRHNVSNLLAHRDASFEFH
jgi:hypothetical protein